MMNMELKDIKFVFDAHTNHCKKGVPQVRIFDKETPYYVHLFWCATTILQEPKLPKILRKKGSQALLYHDLLEDTTKKLPRWLSKEVKDFIKEMTFESYKDEWENIWTKSKEVKLFKLYDKANNLLDRRWINSKKKKQHLENIRKLIKDVESNYGNLNIIKIAKALF